MSSPNVSFWYAFCLCFITDPPFLLGLLQLGVEMMPEDNWIVAKLISHHLLRIGITCDSCYRNQNEMHSGSNLKTFVGIPPHLSSHRAGSDQVHLWKHIQNMFQKIQIHRSTPNEKANPCTHTMTKYLRQHRWQVHSFEIVVHLMRRHIHLQTHRGSALVEPGRQSWAVIGSSYHLVYLFCQKIAKIIQKKKLWPEFTKRTGFSLDWWLWRLPVRWALEMRVLLPGESVCWLPALEIRVLLPAGESVWWSPSPTSAATRGSLIMTSWFLPIH